MYNDCYWYVYLDVKGSKKKISIVFFPRRILSTILEEIRSYGEKSLIAPGHENREIDPWRFVF